MATEPFRVPSKKSIRKAGNIIRNDDATAEEKDAAISLLAEWRSLFGYPINTMQALVRERIKKEGLQDTIVARRLKRMPSIIGKLKRFPDMQLDRIQDIGGLRVVVKNIKDVYAFYNSVAFAKHKHQPILPPHDYIMNPKKDGYRSLHVVFKYYNAIHPELTGLPVELQIRTSLQHSWATALETIDVIEHTSLKTGHGDVNFASFFKLSSALFSIKEGVPVLEEYRNTSPIKLVEEFEKTEAELNVFDTLKAVTVSAKQIEAKGTAASFHLIVLDTKQKKVTLIPYPKNNIEQAEEAYKEQEERSRKDQDLNVVLISAGNVRQIKKAYPNYFLDTQSFQINLSKICKEIKAKIH